MTNFETVDFQKLTEAAKDFLQACPDLNPTFGSSAGITFAANEDAEIISDFLMDSAVECGLHIRRIDVAGIVIQAIVDLDRPLEVIK